MALTALLKAFVSALESHMLIEILEACYEAGSVWVHHGVDAVGAKTRTLTLLWGGLRH